MSACTELKLFFGVFLRIWPDLWTFKFFWEAFVVRAFAAVCYSDFFGGLKEVNGGRNSAHILGGNARSRILDGGALCAGHTTTTAASAVTVTAATTATICVYVAEVEVFRS